MPTTRSFSSHSRHLPNSRMQRSMEGWSVIEKIVDFVHAVCRVTDGRGSAILVALPQQQQNSPLSYETFDMSRSGFQRVETEKVGVLLTTTVVFPTRDDARGATVSFLEQTVVGTNACHGRSVEPIEVPVRADKVFVCSASGASPRQSMRERPSFLSSWARQQKFGGAEREVGSGERLEKDEDEGDEEDHELGYVLTLCDMNPSNGGDGQRASYNASLASRVLNSSVLSETGDNVSLPLSLPPLAHVPYNLVDQSETSIKLGGTFSISGNIARPTTHMGEANPIKPLPLPLLLSRIAPVHVGENHLMVTHTNGKERHYIVQRVQRVGTDSCEYEFFDPACEFSSGGPIFNMQGDFVGLQHQSGNRSYGIFISSIVRHLFQSMVLGMCRLPIVDVNKDAEQVFDKTKAVPDEVFNQPFHINQRSCILNVGGGEQLIEYEDFKRLQLRSDIQGITQAASLAAPEGCLVWKEFYTDFRSLILILHAFSHSPLLAKLAMVEMATKQHRENIPSVATLGGIGIVLEIIDGYPQNEEVVLAAVTLLAHASLFKTNREAISRCDGVLTLLEIMHEYSHQPSILQLGFSCLHNLMAVDSPVRVDAVNLFVRCNGIESAIEALLVHHSDPHVLHHASFALNCVAREDIRYVHIMLRRGITSIIIERVKSKKDDVFVFWGLAALLRGMLGHCVENCKVETAAFASTSLENLENDFLYDVTAETIIRNVDREGFSNEMSAFLQDLVKGKVFTVLSLVTAKALQEKYSSVTVALLQECIEALLVILLICADSLEEELQEMDLVQMCRGVMRDFSTNVELVATAAKIISLCSWSNGESVSECVVHEN